MAKITYMGPIQGESVLKPGEAEWVQLGESTEFMDGAIAVTATAHNGIGGTAHVLKVENINTTCISRGAGQFASFHAGCNVVNNGETTIDSWVVAVAVIKP